MRYHNFTLTLAPGAGDGYRLDAAWGDATAAAMLSAPPASLRAAVNALSFPQRDPQPLQELGRVLFTWLFPAPIIALLREAWAAAEKRGDRLRLALSIAAPELTPWPWELLHDPARSHTFATSPTTLLVRLLTGTVATPPPLPAEPPLDLLLVLPRALDLDLIAERRNVSDVAAALPAALNLRVLDGIVTRSDLADALLTGDYEIVHFGGHGALAEGRGFIALNWPNGDEEWIDENSLARLIANFPTLRLVVLNACNSGQGDDGRGFQGVAPQIVRARAPAVVAMQHIISDAAAATFAREFYKRLLVGEDAGRVDVALAHARAMLAVLHADGSWAAPALYTNIQDGILFVPAPAASAGALDPILQRERLSALQESLRVSAAAEEDWVLADPHQLRTWRGQLRQAQVAYRSQLQSVRPELRAAAAAGLTHTEQRLAAIERALAQTTG